VFGIALTRRHAEFENIVLDPLIHIPRKGLLPGNVLPGLMYQVNGRLLAQACALFQSMFPFGIPIEILIGNAGRGKHPYDSTPVSFAPIGTVMCTKPNLPTMPNLLTRVGAAGALAMAGLCGCSVTHAVLLGPVRAPISPDRVEIYLQPPATQYEQIADISASSRGSFAISNHAKIDKVIERLKKEAAGLGANGILLHGVGSKSAGTVGAGVSTESESGHSPYGLGFGTSVFLSQESGDGVAIYVKPLPPPQ
jgi:hypothetical protein